ncbi:MAG TPA: patatin-like phospholipase family protein [Anaerolineales bacterium]|nr:patatin-like phospholipase family protein [Anaerolineales bacterium]
MNITLALSGGGVKGFAHIGALRVLESYGYRICGIAGTSAGGLVGALYASGYTPDQMEALLRDMDQGNLFSRMHGDGPSLLGFSGVAAILGELLGQRTFSDLRLPLAISATDLTSGLPLMIKSGRLIDAVLATAAVPGVFPAQVVDGHLLVDGGITNPIPVAEARALYPRAPVLAVVLSPPLGWQKDTGVEVRESIPVLMTNLPLVYRLAGRLRLTQAFNLFVNAMDLTGLLLLDKQLQLEHPEVIIRPHMGLIGIVDQVDIPALIKCGEEATLAALPEIRRVTSWQHRLWRRLSLYQASH